MSNSTTQRIYGLTDIIPMHLILDQRYPALRDCFRLPKAYILLLFASGSFHYVTSESFTFFVPPRSFFLRLGEAARSQDDNPLCSWKHTNERLTAGLVVSIRRSSSMKLLIGDFPGKSAYLRETNASEMKFVLKCAASFS